jgi:hypothetical protein
LNTLQLLGITGQICEKQDLCPHNGPYYGNPPLK